MLPPADSPDPRIAGAQYYDRSPLQIALLLFCTLTVYMYYWIIRTRRLADVRLEAEVRPYWHYLGLAVPVLNVYLIFSAVHRADRCVRTRGVSPALPFWLLVLVAFALDLLGRLPAPFWLVCWLANVPIVAMHVWWARAEREEAPTRSWTRFTWGEWTVMIAGTIFVALVFAGMLLDATRAEKGFILGVVAVAAATIVAAAIAAQRLSLSVSRRLTPSAG